MEGDSSMKKYLSLLLCVILVVGLVPGMALADDNPPADGGPAPLYWAYVPEGADTSEAPAEDGESAVNWSDAPLNITESTDIYLAFHNGTKLIPLGEEGDEGIYCSEDLISVTQKGEKAYAFTVEIKGTSSGNGWIGFNQPGPEGKGFEMAVIVGGDEAGGNQGEGDGPQGNPPGPLFWAYADAELEEVTWSSNPLNVVKDGKPVDIYLAFSNGETLIPLGEEGMNGIQFGNDGAFTLEKKTGTDTVYTLTPGTAMTAGWILFEKPDGDAFEMGVRVGDGSGLAVLYNGELIEDGDTIQIPECGGCSMDIYYNGIKNNYTWGMGDTDDSNVSGAGVSPDNQMFEVYLSGNAVAGDRCKVTLFYGDRVNPISATFNVEVTPGIRLTYNDGNTTVMPNGTISGKPSLTVQIVYDGSPVTSGYVVGTEGNCICGVEDLGNGQIEITTLGNGYGDFSVWYNNLESNFTWHGTGITDSNPYARNIVMEIDGVQKQTGERFVLDGNTAFTGRIYLNGELFTENYTIRTEGGGTPKCSAEVNGDGTFTLTTYGITGYSDLVFEYQPEGEQEYGAVFEAQISAPKAYVLQFQNMEQLEDGSWRKAGMATLGVFKKNKQENYVKYVVTDELMRPVGDNYFADVNPEDLLVVYYVPEVGDYVPVPEDQIPFTFEPVDGQSGMMKITYRRGLDKYGPAYMLVYTDYENDKYLQYDSPETPAVNTIFLWTRSVSDFINWEKLQGENHRWHYNAKMDTYEGFEDTNDECDVKYVAVELQEDLFGEGENKVEVVENESTMEIETDLCTITFDDKVLTQIDNADKDVTLDILNVEEDDEEYREFSSVLSKATCILDLNLNHEDGKISDFGEGKVTVKLNYQLQDSDKTPYVYYVDSQGVKHLVECKYDASKGELTFEINHFSLFEVEEVTETTGGSGSGGSRVPADRNAAAKSEASRAVASYVDTAAYEAAEADEIAAIIEQAKKDIEGAKTAEEIQAIEAAAKAEIDKIETAEEKALIADVQETKFKARSSMTTLRGKKAIKVTWNAPEDMDFDGYDVFRSTKRYEGFGKKPFFTTKKNSYTNNKDLKSGKTYYYKVRAFKYVNDEKIYTQWSHKAWRTIKK